MKIMVAWIGAHDLKASEGDEKSSLGPIGQVISEREFDRIVLLCNYERVECPPIKIGSPCKPRHRLKLVT
jgi:hypothetical protein